ncbi:MAG: DUF3006 domain-containing protein [Methanomicrobiaceae archaeon]|nr:DUF3006 domain-containing protein [Methanomicrobiaceae archaeon]MDD5419244.1 DUF3006 domain-containing protein [Methanomicrobiaceae archaeon]
MDEKRLTATIDRIEEGVAVLLCGDEPVRFTLPVGLLPGGIREGDIIDIAFRRNLEATEEARRRVAERIERLRRRE